MADDYSKIPFTIVKEIQIDRHSEPDEDDEESHDEYRDGLKIKVSNIYLTQHPQETLSMQAYIFKIIDHDNRGFNKRRNLNYNSLERNSYNYDLQLKFSNYLHEFNQNYSYEIICKIAEADQQESKYLFCCMLYRLEESISCEGKFSCTNDLIDDSTPNLHFYIRRLNNNNSFEVDDKNMQKVISTLRNVGCDAVLETKDIHLNAHRAILAQNSKVFQTMFSVGMKESQDGHVKMLEFEAKVVRKMLDYLYTRQLGKIGDVIESLFKLAHQYQMHDLCRRCEEYYIFNVKVDNDNIIEVLNFSALYELEKLNECAINFANRHEKELIRLASFRKYIIQSINLDNAVPTLLLADKYADNAADVEMKIFEFIKNHYQQMMKDQRFVELFESKSRLMKEVHIYMSK